MRDVYLREVQREGFTCRIETINTLEAWLGTLPRTLTQMCAAALFTLRIWQICYHCRRSGLVMNLAHVLYIQLIRHLFYTVPHLARLRFV